MASLKEKPRNVIEAKARITASVQDFVHISGISRAYIYKLLKRGEIKSVCIGDRRLIILDSYLDLIHRLDVNG